MGQGKTGLKSQIFLWTMHEKGNDECQLNCKAESKTTAESHFITYGQAIMDILQLLFRFSTPILPKAVILATN